jgi:hypothetical protein
VRDATGIQPEIADPVGGPRIVLGVNRVGEQELGLALRGVDLNWQRHGRSDEHAFRTGFRHDEGAFLDAEPAAKVGGDNHGAALARPDRSPECHW